MKSVKIAYKHGPKLDINDLNEFQGELKSLSTEEFQKLRRSILEDDFSFSPHVWFNPKDKKNYLLDGHQRIRVIKHLRDQEQYDIPKIPTVTVTAKSYRQAKRKLLSAVSQHGKPDSQGLYEFVIDAGIHPQELLERFSIPEIDIEKFNQEYFLNDEDKQGLTDPDSIPTLTQSSKIRPGDLFILGNHRLICGDSTDIKLVRTLMEGKKADVVFTDPPYNLASETELYSSHIRSSYKKLGQESWDNDFDIKHSLEIIDQVRDEDCSVYICTSSFISGTIFEWAKKAKHSGYVIWNKPNPMPSLAKRHWVSEKELITYTTFGKHVFNYPNQGHALSVWNLAKTPKNDLHPTMKPVEVPEHAIRHSSNKNYIVLDLFGGAGSTLIACEKTSRKCYMMEIDPHYCSVILDRWMAFTGEEPLRSDGKAWSQIKKRASAA